MIFAHRYAGASGVAQTAGATAMSFAPDTLRPPTYFRGRITRQLEFREAISALHDVVTADLRFIPKDRSGYLAWRAQRSYVDTAQLVADQQRIAEEMTVLRGELVALETRSTARRREFFDARQRYFHYLYERDRELWFKLDPVITVHPDQVFFECFSRDESSYGRLAASYNVFEELGERAHGTTNIDYSEALYGEFQRIRSYKTTSLAVDPSGFDVTTSMEDAYREVKIDLPETWVRGFLQVSAAATLPADVVELHPMDVHNVCLLLRRNKELFGPRSLKFQLTPGAPVAITVDPWGTVVRCPRSRYLESKPGASSGANGPTEVRIWGRRRLLILERLLPLARRVRVFLLGTGQPSYWVVDLGELSFTLGLSGWTMNNWSEAGNFDLMAAREDVDDATRQRVFDELGQTWLATPGELAARTGLDAPIVASALAGWVQAGRAIFDLDRGVYRKRELTRDPLPMDKLRFASEREAKAAKLLHRGKVAVDRADAVDGGLVLAGRIQDQLKLFAAGLTFDADRRIVAGECSCDYFIRNRLHRGPCEHMLALRAAHRRGVSDTIAFDPKRGAERGAERGAGASSGRNVARDEARESFQAAFRRAVMRAAELRAANRIRDSIAELERIHRLTPPDSDEHARLAEVIAEAWLDAEEPQQARAMAELALSTRPHSPLALRIKRDALNRLDDVAAAIVAARDLAQVENTAARWEELVALCQRVGDHAATLQFAEDGLRRHPRTAGLMAARNVAQRLVKEARSSEPGAPATAAGGARTAGAATGAATGARTAGAAAAGAATGASTAGAAAAGASQPGATPAGSAPAGASAAGATASAADPAAEDPAPAKQSWWRRAVNKLTGRASPAAPGEPPSAATALEDALIDVIDELAIRARVIDRTGLLQALRLAYMTADHEDGQVMALVDALKRSHAIRDLPSDQDLIALLRGTLP